MSKLNPFTFFALCASVGADAVVERCVTRTPGCLHGPCTRSIRRQDATCNCQTCFDCNLASNAQSAAEDSMVAYFVGFGFDHPSAWVATHDV